MAFVALESSATVPSLCLHLYAPPPQADTAETVMEENRSIGRVFIVKVFFLLV